MTTAATLPVPPQHRHDARRECEPEVPLAEPVLEQEPRDQHAWRKLHDPRTGCRHEYQEDCRKHTAIVPMMVGRGVPSGQLEHPRTIGVHLMPLADAVDSPRPSVVVHIDERGRIEAISLVHTIAEIVSGLGPVRALPPCGSSMIAASSAESLIWRTRVVLHPDASAACHRAIESAE